MQKEVNIHGQELLFTGIFFDAKEQKSLFAQRILRKPEKPKQLEKPKPILSIGLTNKEISILHALETAKKLHIDKIVYETDLPVHEVLSTLFMLELQNKVRQHPGMMYSRL